MDRPPAGAGPRPRHRPDLRVLNHDRMRRDVTVEVVREGEVAGKKRASLPRGSDSVWRGVFDTPGRYRVTVALRYGPTETVEWLLEHPRREALDVVVVTDGVEVIPWRRRV